MKNVSCLMFFFSCLFFMLPACSEKNNKAEDVDICIYGASSAGVMAAYTAKIRKKSVLLLEPGKHLGGLTTGGLRFFPVRTVAAPDGEKGAG